MKLRYLSCLLDFSNLLSPLHDSGHYLNLLFNVKCFSITFAIKMQ